MREKVYETSPDSRFPSGATVWRAIQDLETIGGFHVTLVREAEDPHAEWKAAHARGEVIQETYWSDEWSDLRNPLWSRPVSCYRVKPKVKITTITWCEIDTRIDRCLITKTKKGLLCFTRINARTGKATERRVHEAVNMHDFAGFEFKDGKISGLPWNENFSEYAKYVLFRR